MDNNNWFEDVINDLQQSEPQFDRRAIYEALTAYLQELEQRIAQKEVQIDGELWNHQEW